MVNPLSFVGVRDCTLEPTIEQRGIARAAKALEEPAVGAISQVRTVEYIGNTTVISPYLEKYRPQHQKLIEGVPVDPVLRPDFDSTDNNDRDPLEIEDWWDVPFLVTNRWSHESYDEYIARLKNYPDMELDDEPTFEARKEKSKKQFFDEYPDGIAYEVRCLDGGAWDRSTWWGEAGSIEGALQIIGKRISGI